MGLSGCYSFAKCLLLVINIIFAIVGITFVSFAIWMFFSPPAYVLMTESANDFTISVSILFVAGVLLLVVFFLGWCGTAKESICMLFTFFSILLVILVAKIAAGVWCYMNSDSLSMVIYRSVKDTVHKEYHHDPNRKLTFDVIQQGLECCGADNPADWIGDRKDGIVPFPISEGGVRYNIPESCCRTDITKDTCIKVTQNVLVGSKIDDKAIFPEGCYQKLVKTLKDNAWIIFGVGIAIVVIEALGLILALILAFAVINSGRYKA